LKSEKGMAMGTLKENLFLLLPEKKNPNEFQSRNTAQGEALRRENLISLWRAPVAKRKVATVEFI
jgi:hypothetical protein